MSNFISIFIITYNEERIIRKCLEKLLWADEIIIVDSGSTDKTVEICKEFGAKIVYNKFENFGKQKQFALSLTKNDWVLSLDADEILSNFLINEILNFDLVSFEGYRIPRTHVFLNKIFKYGAENKKPILRLFNKNHGQFNHNIIHETIIVDGAIGNLKGEMLHYTVFDISTAIQKQIKYALLGGEQYFENNRGVSTFKVVVKFPFDFIRYYFIHRNFLNGYEGFVWSLFSAFANFLKYAKLKDLCRTNF
jgi:glycosyltransferase involved in cell wall biosynthesis